jgi:hypothetical protein
MQPPSKVTPDIYGGKKDNQLKEDHSLDSLNTFTSFAAAA